MEPRFTVPVYYDFASTICFVAHRVLERMRDEVAALGIALEWRPIDLVGITGWKRGVTVEGPRRENALRVARELGVTARMPATWLDSRPAHGVALALPPGPRQIAWRERVWSAVFEEGRDIGAPGEIARLGEDLALDTRALADDALLVRLGAEAEAAREAGVTGVPTFHLDFPLGGIQEPATMKLLFQRWVANRLRAAGGNE